MKVKCPCCGYVEDVSVEYIGEIGICDACGHEFVVGQTSGGLQQNADVAIVQLSMADFQDGSTRIKCPLCGEDNILPITAINRSVRCGVCDSKFFPTINENGNAHKEQVSHKHRSWLIVLGIIAGIIYAVVFTPLSDTMLGLVYPILPNAIKEKIQQRKESELYEQMLAWYDAQLEYNGLYESNVINREGQKVLMFGDGTRIEMDLDLGSGLGTRLYYSPNLTKGFAQELIEARILINDYECSHNIQRTRVRNLMHGGLSKTPASSGRK